MDDVERLFTQLVRVLAESQPDRLTAAFQLSELYQSMIPYRKYKKQLGFESNEDYEMAVLRLFAGVSDYATVEPEEVREQLVIEAEATNPNPGAFREFAAARVKLNSSAVRSVQTASKSFAPPSSGEAPNAKPEQWAQFAPPVDLTVEEIPKTPVFESLEHPGAGAATIPMEPKQPEPGCPSCNNILPGHRKVQFCPFCGSQVAPVPCTVCGDEIEVGWRFCITCGRDGSDR
jgi:hypothetical protein